MKSPLPIFLLPLVAVAFLFAGCATAPKTTTTISGQILVNDEGKIQKTGLAPIWIYDATNVQLAAQIPLPNFGGRSRADLTRIRKEYPAVLTVCSNYQAVMDKTGPAQIRYGDLNQKYHEMKEALHGQTNGPDYDAVKQQGAVVWRAWEENRQAWDAADDQRELLFYWFNVNPGLLYAGLPQPLATTQADTNGNFSITLPRSKDVLLVAHIEGTVNGQPGHYFWLQPLSTKRVEEQSVTLNGDNVHLTKRNSELKPMMIYVLLDSGNGGLSIGQVHRIRDSQQNWVEYWRRYYSTPN